MANGNGRTSTIISAVTALAVGLILYILTGMADDIDYLRDKIDRHLEEHPAGKIA